MAEEYAFNMDKIKKNLAERSAKIRTESKPKPKPKKPNGLPQRLRTVTDEELKYTLPEGWGIIGPLVKEKRYNTNTSPENFSSLIFWEDGGKYGVMKISGRSEIGRYTKKHQDYRNLSRSEADAKWNKETNTITGKAKYPNSPVISERYGAYGDGKEGDECPHCGSGTIDEDGFCNECEWSEDALMCPNCGGMMDDVGVCLDCGKMKDYSANRNDYIPYIVLAGLGLLAYLLHRK